MKKLVAVAAIAGLMGSAAAFADAGADLAKAKNCLACHAVDKKLVGPAYNAVAACYPNADKATKEKLHKHIKAGGSGVFGPVPMPGHPQVSDGDIDKLVNWVLTLKGGTCPKEFKKS